MIKVYFEDSDLEEYVLEDPIRIMETRNEFTPKKTILPGSVLKLELEERGIKQKDFAREIGLPASNLNEYIHGKRGFTADFSLKLEDSLGIAADIWMNLQQNYELALARKQQLDIEEQMALNDLEEYDKIISIKDLTKRLGITSVSRKNILHQLTAMLNLKPAAELQVYAGGKSYFKKSSKSKNDPRMILTWILLAKAEIKKVEVSGVFDISRKEKIINELQQVLHLNINSVNRVRDILSKNGIKFCIVEKMDSTPIDGYSFYDEDVPCIVVTKRRDTIDNFAFCIMHELGHLFLHLGENQSVEFVTLEEKERADKCEREADKFANDGLIPENIWKKSPAVKLDQYQIQKKYTEWADHLQLNKWIVLGRIGHELDFWRFKEDGTRRIS